MFFKKYKTVKNDDLELLTRTQANHVNHLKTECDPEDDDCLPNHGGPPCDPDDVLCNPSDEDDSSTPSFGR